MTRILTKTSTTAIAAILALALAALPVAAQDWKGTGRIHGVVQDEAGQPIEGAKITLTVASSPGSGPEPITTNDKGKWAYLGLDGGEWRVVIEKEGYVTSEGTFPISEAAIGPGRPLTITLRKVPPATAGTAEGTTTPDKGSEILGWVQQGNELMQQQKYAEARAEYQKALAEVPRDKQLPLLRGIAQTYNQEANAQAAIDTLKSGLEINPDDPETLRLLVSLLVASGKEAEAQQYVAKLPADAKTDPNVLLNIGIELYNKKDLDGALTQFNKVVNDYPDNADVRYYRGLVLLNQGKNADAAADFKKLLEIAPNHANAAEAKDFLKYLETQQ